MTHFTPIAALAGGALIGLSAVLLMLSAGRIAGISGIFGGCLVAGAQDRSWRLAFIAGLIAAPLVAGFMQMIPIIPVMPKSWLVTVAAGLLVGFGARLGGGCTSGHGVCGIARLSPRSIAATVIFMSAAVAVVYVTRHVLGG